MNKATFMIAVSTYLVVVGCLMYSIGSDTEGIFRGIEGVLNTLDWLGKYLTGG